MFAGFRTVLVAGIFLATAVSVAPAQTTVRIPTADCAALVAHRPAPDVAYKPGVDAHGDRVDPADLPGSRFSFEVPRTVEFDISFNPLEGAAARRFPRSELVVGRLKYDLKSGEATFNDQPLSGPELAELARKCQRELGDNR
jgi:hypothetical protein